MPLRRGMLCSLLLTALLLLTLPTVRSRLFADDGRVSPRLKPARQQPLTVWLIGDRTDSLRLLRREIAAFEKQTPGARVYLRSADAGELYAEGAVRPDVVLFSPGTVLEDALLPIAGDPPCRQDAAIAGVSAGERYALPLWYAPSVLCVPNDWIVGRPAATATATPLFALGTPPPTSAVQPKPTEPPPELPWQSVAGSVAARDGVALAQLAAMCPASERARLTETLTPQWNADGKLKPRGDAALLTLKAYRKALADGKPITGFALTPAASDAALFLGFSRDSALARAFADRLLSADTQSALDEHGLFPVRTDAPHPTGERVARELSRLYQANLLLPNAFAHTREELDQLCRAALTGDPIETLLRLR